MRYLLLGLLASSCLFMTTNATAADSWVRQAKVTSVEFYGSQFTVTFDKEHQAKGCGHPGNVVAMNTSSEPGKTHYSFFLAAYTTGKLVSVRITDDGCSGDRPTIRQIQGH